MEGLAWHSLLTQSVIALPQPPPAAVFKQPHVSMECGAGTGRHLRTSSFEAQLLSMVESFVSAAVAAFRRQILSEAAVSTLPEEWPKCPTPCRSDRHCRNMNERPKLGS